MLDNMKELMEQEQRIKKQQAERDANKLRVQRVVLEHKQSGQRYTYHILGWNAEKDFQDFIVEFHLQNSKEAPKCGVAEQTGFMNTIDFIPKEVRKELVLSWMPELHADTKEKIKKYLSGKK